MQKKKKEVFGEKVGNCVQMIRNKKCDFKFYFFE